jgi:hypothetical protein
MSQITRQTSEPVYIGIDFHKHYSAFCLRGQELILDILI